MKSSKINQYRLTLLSSVLAQRAGDIETEDGYLAYLDSIWLSMTPEERAESNDIARRVGAGEISLDQLICSEASTVSNSVAARAPRKAKNRARISRASQECIEQFDVTLDPGDLTIHVFAESKPGEIMPAYPVFSTGDYRNDFQGREYAVC